MNKTKYNFFEQIRYAILKPMEYFRLTKVSGGRMTGFVFLFVLITSLFTIIPLCYSIAGPNGFSKFLREDLPSFQMTNGELSVDGRFEEKDGGTYVLCDTSVEEYSINDIDYSYSQAILISKTNVVVYQFNGTKEYSFKNFNGIHFDNEIVNSLIPLIYIILVIIVIIMYLIMVGAYFFTALLFSLIGLFVASTQHITLPYATIFKIAIYSKVTMAILSAILDVIPIYIPGIINFALAVVITSAYIIYGIRSFNSDAAREEAALNAPPDNPYM